MKTEHYQKDHTGIFFSGNKLKEIIKAANRGESLEVFNNGELFRTITPDATLAAIKNPELGTGGFIYHDYQARGYKSENELRLT